MGYLAIGISTKPDKVKAINQLDPPLDISEVRSLLGFTNHLASPIGDGTKDYYKFLTCLFFFFLKDTQTSRFLAGAHIHSSLTLWACAPVAMLQVSSVAIPPMWTILPKCRIRIRVIGWQLFKRGTTSKQFILGNQPRSNFSKPCAA